MSEFFFIIPILILSVVIHEVSHGLAAERLGDPTARLAGRLTLNPLRHLDPVGSFLVPALSYALGGFILGWAKPVPYNPYNLRWSKWDEAIVAVAGPLSNAVIAIFFGLVLRFTLVNQLINSAFLEIFSYIIFINLILMVFNLIPAPPLDGSKILFAFLSYRNARIREFMESNSLLLVFIAVFFLWRLILPVVFFLFRAIAGFPLSF